MKASNKQTKADDQAALRTVAEQSQFRRTGRYDEVQALCAAYARSWPQTVRSFEFGRTPEGRVMLAMVVSHTGALTAADIKRCKIPVLLLQGGIHPGECDGKDAGFIALREMLEGRAAAGVLDRIAILFVPVFCVDGHERFRRWNRPNQVGPEEMGFRASAQNLNLNRDYAKADSPEMHALLSLLNEWDPIIYTDLHVTDGADFQHDVSVLVDPIFQGDRSLHDASRELRQRLLKELENSGSLPLPFYPNLQREDDPASGFADFALSPRYSTGYWAWRNRFGVVVETHSWKDYATRVRITRNIIVALAELTAAKGAALQRLAAAADRASRELGNTELALDFAPGPDHQMIDFLGFAYTREPSAVSGALATRYDPAKPMIWRVPFRGDIQPTRTVRLPAGGYVVPAAYADLMGERLTMHGIEHSRMDRADANAQVEMFRATEVTFEPKPFEGRMMVAVEGEWSAGTADIPAGSLFVPIAQSKGRLVAALLEPRAPDSFVSWGFFNAVFEQKEYLEPYVAEQIAREMLANDAKVADEFQRLLDQDQDFARNPAARLEFFYRRHPSWDERFNLYPIYRTARTSFDFGTDGAAGLSTARNA